MAKKRSKLWCSKCDAIGGILVRRLAGNGNNNRYFYMVHYDGTKKSKKRSCYLGYSGLFSITLNDERFLSKYERFIEYRASDAFKSLEKDEQYRVFIVLLNLLIDMGWPKKFVLEKYFADIYFYKFRRPFEELEKRLKNSAFHEKQRLKPDYSKVNDRLDECLSKLFRSDEFIQLKLILK